ncbi:MAG: DinB family protein [Bacteroidota bacterium]
MQSAESLRQSIAYAVPRLLVVPQPDQPLALEKWSPKEIVGHLIDSAANNYVRCIRAGDKGGLVFDGYDQDAWVSLGRYADARWPDLIELWRLYNEQFARVIDGLPDDVLDRPHVKHSLDRIAWRLVPANEPATLRYLIDDYIGHLHHHLRQIDRQLVAIDAESAP